MKHKSTQEQRIINKLLKDGYVTRNEALKNYISRLSAIILDLQKEGWEFSTEFIKSGNNGKDYIYRVVKAPFKRIKYTTPDGKEIIKYEKSN